ncbi:MAG: hypothetical protein KC466_06740 [Myxococcales bacterium]|nr:hypothetical protein [Myxococcales bacterium]
MKSARPDGPSPRRIVSLGVLALVTGVAVAVIWAAPESASIAPLAGFLYATVAFAVLAGRREPTSPIPPFALGVGSAFLWFALFSCLSLGSLRPGLTDGFVGADWHRLTEVLARMDGRPLREWLANAWRMGVESPEFAPGDRGLWGLLFGQFELAAPLYRVAVLAAHAGAALALAALAGILSGSRAVALMTGALYAAYPAAGSLGAVHIGLGRAPAAAAAFGGAWIYARARAKGWPVGVVVGLALALAAFAMGPEGRAGLALLLALELAMGRAWRGGGSRWAGVAATAGLLPGAHALLAFGIVGDLGFEGPDAWLDRVRALPLALAAPVETPALGGDGALIARGLVIAAFIAVALAGLRSRTRPRIESFGLLAALGSGLLLPWRGAPPAGAVAGLAVFLASILVPVAGGAARRWIRAAQGGLVLVAFAYLSDLGARPWHEAASVTTGFLRSFEDIVADLERGEQVFVVGFPSDPAHGVDAADLKEAIRVHYLLFDAFDLRILGHSDRDPFVRGLLDPAETDWGTSSLALAWNDGTRRLESRTFALRRVLEERGAGAYAGADQVWNLADAGTASRWSWGLADPSATAPTSEGTSFDPAAARFVVSEAIHRRAASADEIRFVFAGADPGPGTPARFELRWATDRAPGWRGSLWSREIDPVPGGHAVVFPVGRSLPWLLAGDVERLSVWFEDAPRAEWTLRAVEWIAPTHADADDGGADTPPAEDAPPGIIDR